MSIYFHRKRLIKAFAVDRSFHKLTDFLRELSKAWVFLVALIKAIKEIITSYYSNRVIQLPTENNNIQMYYIQTGLRQNCNLVIFMFLNLRPQRIFVNCT